MSCDWCQRSGQNSSLISGEYKAVERRDTIVKLFDKAIKKHKKEAWLDAPAVIFENRAKYSFAELAELSTRVAHVLSIELGELLTSNTDNDLIVGYCLFPSADVILAILSILKLGAGYMCFDAASTPERLIRQVGCARPISILIDENVSMVKRFESVSKATKLLSLNYVLGLALKIQPSRSKLLRVQPELNVLESPFALVERVAAIVYTAGSTGNPHAVRLSHQAIVNAVKGYLHNFPFVRGEEVSCLCTPTDSAHSVVEIFAPLCRLVPLVIIPRRQLADPIELLESVHVNNVTRITLQPAHLNRLLTHIGRHRSEIYQCRGLKYVFTTNSPLTHHVAKDFFTALHPKNSVGGTGSGDPLATDVRDAKELSVDKEPIAPEVGAPWLVNVYSLAETTGEACFQILRDLVDLEMKVEGNRVPLGRPMCNTVIYVMDEDQRVVGLDTVGEICVAGLAVSKGYCGMESSHKFLKNVIGRGEDNRVLFRTGDYGRVILCKDGKKRLLFEKRAEAEVRVGGKMYDLNKIQQYVSRLGMTDDCVVVCYNRDLPDQRIIVGCVLGLGVPLQHIDEHLKKCFGGKLVAEVFSIEEVPLQTNGKLDREQFINKYKDHLRIDQVPLEKWSRIGVHKDDIGTVQEICEAVAKAMCVSASYVVDSLQLSLSEMGGDSLSTMAVIASLQRSGLSIKFSEFINAASMMEIVRLLIKRKDIRNSMKFAPCVSCPSLGVDLFSYEDVSSDFESQVVELVSSSYAEKSMLCLVANVSPENISSLVRELWDSFLASNASMLATTRGKGDPAGAVLCQELPAKIRKMNGRRNKMCYLFELLQRCNQQALEKIKAGDSRVLAVQLVGASNKLNAREIAILLVTLVEAAAERGERSGYDIMLITSENSIIRDICRDAVKYRWVTSAVAKDFVSADGATPFRHALRHNVVNTYCQYLR